MRFSNLTTVSLMLSNGVALAFAPSGRGRPSQAAIRTFASRTALDEMKDGAFKRKDAAWRNWISREEGAEFAPEKDRVSVMSLLLILKSMN
jgi:hypothetical protein